VWLKIQQAYLELGPTVFVSTSSENKLCITGMQSVAAVSAQADAAQRSAVATSYHCPTGQPKVSVPASSQRHCQQCIGTTDL